MLNRRRFLRYSAALAGSTVVGGSLWQEALASFPAQAGPGPYGPLQAPDANGLRLPVGFSSRVIAQSTQEVIAGSGFSYPILPDGGACFADDDGWIYVVNSEFDGTSPANPNPLLSGVTSIRFDAGANITDAYKILDDSRINCAGGATPWDTWLSCEEVPPGIVWECDPWGVNAAVERLGMGRFKHEAAASDRDGRCFYLTEDEPDGALYRYTPDVWDESQAVWPNPTLASGRLDFAAVSAGMVTWHEVPNPNPDVFAETPTRNQVAADGGVATPFNGGEGIVYRAGHIYFTTKGDNRIWDYETLTGAISVLYDDDLDPGVQLTGVDNVAVAASGDLLIAEDKGDVPQQLVLITPKGIASPLVEISHALSEIAGPAWNPAGTHLYFSSQRGPLVNGVGITYEVTGPFRHFVNGGCQGF